MPKAVVKKGKAEISKAATKKKPAAKKWTKGKVKEKSDNAVFLDQATYDRYLTIIPKLGRHISTTHLIEKFKVVGSIARILLRKCVANGSIKCTEAHSKQALYTPTVVIEKVAADTKENAGKKGKKK